MSRFLSLFLAGFLSLIAAAPAHAANWFELNFGLSGPRYDAVLPPCDAALGTIQSRFATREGRFWNSDLRIVGFKHIRQIAFRPWVESAIPRKFCVANL